MAFIDCRFFSQTLDLSCAMHVILPQCPQGNPATIQRLREQGYPTLYLLHGLSDDHATWTRQTSIERYVEKMNLAVVMPAAGRSFYTDIPNSLRYGHFIAEELPAVARNLFPLSAKREDNFVAGLSMGGYGAFKLALTYPERFAAAASLSGALDMAHRTKAEETQETGELRHIFGPAKTMAATGHDLFALAQAFTGKSETCPSLFQRCGTEDFLIEDNERFATLAQSIGLPLNYATGPGFHNWAYWDEQIRHVLAWLPLQENANQ